MAHVEYNRQPGKTKGYRIEEVDNYAPPSHIQTGQQGEAENKGRYGSDQDVRVPTVVNDVLCIPQNWNHKQCSQNYKNAPGCSVVFIRIRKNFKVLDQHAFVVVQNAPEGSQNQSNQAEASSFRYVSSDS